MKWTTVLLVLLGIVVVLGTVVGVGFGLLAGAVRQPGEAVEQPDADGGPEASATRTNAAGAVTFEVTPLSLDSSSETLDFEVVMNTHSVDLGFDLAQQAVLRTDTGAEVAPSAYRGGSGHHVTGRLSFPAAETASARTLTLLVRDVAGVAEREFVWEIQ